MYTSVAPIGKALYKLLTVQAFRADRLTAMASIFVATVMGESFTHSADQELNLAEIVTYEVKMNVSLLILGITEIVVIVDDLFYVLCNYFRG